MVRVLSILLLTMHITHLIRRIQPEDDVIDASPTCSGTGNSDHDCDGFQLVLNYTSALYGGICTNVPLI